MDSVRSGAFGHLFRPDNFIFGKFPLPQPLLVDPTAGKPRSTETRAESPLPVTLQSRPDLPNLQLGTESQRKGSVQGTETTCDFKQNDVCNRGLSSQDP